MKDLTHSYERFGCKIDADLENTVAVLTDPDGKELEFVADKPIVLPNKKRTLAEKLEAAPKNALWHATQHAKADQKARAEAAEKARRDAKPANTDEPEEPTDIDTTDVEHVEGVKEQ